MKLISTPLALLAGLFIASCSSDSTQQVASPNGDAGERFANSIVSTDIDFITSDDPDAFSKLTYVGQDRKEMPDSRTPDGLDEPAELAALFGDAFVFAASFSDRGTVELWMDSAFGDVAAAEAYARKAAGPLGKLPGNLRRAVSHVVVHDGDAGAFAQEGGPGFFVLYADNMDVRIGDRDLEETVFHESVHVALDAVHADSPDWLEAQANDGAFVTTYGRLNPAKEDFAETAIFAYTMLTHPGRLSPDVEGWIEANVPNRFEYFRSVFIRS